MLFSDTARKTCHSLAGYVPRADGGIDNPATILVSPNPVLTMSVVSPVAIKAGQVCGYLRAEDVAAASFAIAGQPANDAQTATLRERVGAAMKPLFGHELCTAYAPDGDALIAKPSIDGVPQAGKDERVIWVAPADGYRVAP